MKTTGFSPGWLPNWMVTSRGSAPSRGRDHLVKARKFAVITVGLLLALTLARPARALTWDIHIVDSEGDVGWWTSIALDSSGNPHISYFDRSHEHLKYASKWLPRLWTRATVDSGDTVGQFTSIALDSSGPHISYTDFVGEGNRDLKYARKVSSGGWRTETVDADGDVGWFSSIALDAGGQPHVAYYDFGNGKLKYAWRSRLGGWSIETVDSDENVGGHTSIALDSSGKPHISYFDWLNGNLKYARKMCTRLVLETGQVMIYCFWAKWTVDAGNVMGAPTSIALDSSGLPHIGYTVFEGGYPKVKYARRLTSGSWSLETVDSGGGVNVSMVLDSSNLPHISYPDSSSRTLKYARRLPSGGWSRETVDTESTGHNSIALDSSGNPHISYYDDGNHNLKYAKGHRPWTNTP
jgi:hypothetical protein